MPSTDPDRESLDRRLAAVERALAEDEPVERASRLDELEAHIAELEAAVQALRGYVGAVRAVNDDVQHRADLALRKASALERHVAPENGLNGDHDAGTPEPGCDHDAEDTGETTDQATDQTTDGTVDADGLGVLQSLRRTS